ncbi:MAG: tetratricopeptide repeat protein, partial [Anaerolineae bacterium]|nr:tetratricopeptide repeat protein [Anaerolineae bacterium]
HHLARSNRSADAVAWYQRAGERAAARFAHEEALHYLGRALALTDAADLTAHFDLYAGCEWIYQLRGERERQEAVLADMHALADALDDAQRCTEVALRQSAYLYDTGDFDAAAARALAAVDLADRVPADAAPALQARAWLHLVSPLLRAGDYARAGQALDRAIPLARAAGQPLLEANALSKLGTLHYYQAQFDRARQGYEQSLAIHRSLGNPDGESAELGNLGLVAYEQGDYEQAQTCAEQALALKRQTGDRGGEGWLLNILGMLAFDTGRYADARGFYAEAVAIAQEVGDRWGESNAVSNLGIVCCTLGEHRAADHCYDEALGIKHEIGDQRGAALTLAFQSLLYHRLSRDEQALALSSEALARGARLEDAEVEGYGALYQGHALAALGRLPEARQAYARSHAARRAAGHPALLAETAAGLADVALSLGQVSAAREHVDAILPLLETGTLTGAVEPVRAYLACYRVLRATGDPAARRVLATARRLLKSQAAQIPNQDARRAFLASCAEHRAIVQAWETGSMEKDGNVDLD